MYLNLCHAEPKSACFRFHSNGFPYQPNRWQSRNMAIKQNRLSIHFIDKKRTSKIFHKQHSKCALTHWNSTLKTWQKVDHAPNRFLSPHSFSIVLAFCLISLIRFNRSIAFIFVNDAMERQISHNRLMNFIFSVNKRMNACQICMISVTNNSSIYNWSSCELECGVSVYSIGANKSDRDRYKRRKVSRHTKYETEYQITNNVAYK